MSTDPSPSEPDTDAPEEAVPDEAVSDETPAKPLPKRRVGWVFAVAVVFWAIDLVTINLDNTVRVIRNDAAAASGNHWLEVLPMVGKRDAIGAKVLLKAGAHKQLGLCLRAYSYLASNDPKVHFGLGKADKVDSIEIVWPTDGAVVIYGDRIYVGTDALQRQSDKIGGNYGFQQEPDFTFQFRTTGAKLRVVIFRKIAWDNCIGKCDEGSRQRQHCHEQLFRMYNSAVQQVLEARQVMVHRIQQPEIGYVGRSKLCPSLVLLPPHL